MLRLGFDKRAFGSFLILVTFLLLTLGTVLAIQHFPQFSSKASSSNQPTAIQVVNLTQDHVTITWSTTDPTTGFLAFGDTASMGHTHLDDRDTEDGQAKPYRTHMVSLSHLAPRTKYYYTISSNNQTFDRDGFPFVFFTTGQPQGTSTDQMLVGKVLAADRTPAQGYIVALTFEQDGGGLSNVIGGITQTSGDFSLDLSLLRSADGTLAFPLQQGKTYNVDITMHDPFGNVSAQSVNYAVGQAFPTLIFGSQALQIPASPLNNSVLLVPATPQATATPKTRQDLFLILPSTPVPTQHKINLNLLL